MRAGGGVEKALIRTEIKELNLLKRGKVRDVYEVDDNLLIVTTDRISAFDVVLPNGVPGKGEVLNKLSLFWFEYVSDIIDNHVVEGEVERFPSSLSKYKNILKNRSIIARKTHPFPFECVVRGYLAGSGWKEYRESGSICGIKLPNGLIESQKLPEPIFTPATKAEEGHDTNISIEEMASHIGDVAYTLKDLSIEVYKKASEFAAKKGIIIADTKMEFGLYEGKIIIIDELLTPDSSRFWLASSYKEGIPQDSYDKQIVRDYLETIDWDKTYPGPTLPERVVEKTSRRYREIFEMITT